jgi:hypothetical protein
VRQIAVELPMMATVAAIIAVLVLVAGRSIEPPSQPFVLPSRTVQSPGDAVEACIEAPVSARSGADAVGRATLCHRGTRLRVSLQASILTTGETYTALLTYVPQPGQCTDSPCGQVDLPDERPRGLNLRVDGVVVSPFHAVEVDAEVPDSRLPSGAWLSLMLLPETGNLGPPTEAVFTIP